MNIIIIHIAFLCLIEISVGQKYLSYVCHSFSSYSIIRAKNSKCYYNGDVLNSFEEIAQSYGYNTQVFEVVTEDQYILSIFRISPMNSTSVGAPVLIAHGALVSATSYVLVGNRSLAFLLADEGYDVWLINFRGTNYSNKHKFLNSDDKRYWNYSFHEFGIYDIKSTIDLVTSTTKQKVIYIGWSLGARSYYVYNTIYPDEAIKKVRVSISLAPTVYPYLAKVMFVKITKIIPFWILKGVLDTLFPNGVFYYKTSALVKGVLHLCFDSPPQVFLCRLIKELITGSGFQQEEPESFPVLIAQSTEATSVKTAYHSIQLAKAKKFQQFDYGKENNIMRYGTPNPPLYNLSLINLPMYIIYGSTDILAPEESATLLYKVLPDIAKPFGSPYRVKNDIFCHSNMVSAKDIKTLLNNPIIQFLKEKEVYFNN